MKTLLISGATGFIGRHFVEHALEHGYSPIVLARKSSKTKYFEQKKVPVVILSFYDPEKLVEEIKILIDTYGIIDNFIHIAGLTQSLKVSDFYNVNYQITKNLVDAFSNSTKNPPKFIFVSSIAALGPGDPYTFKPITEDQSPNPVTYYGKSKLMAEQYLKSQTHTPWIILRPTIVYGPHEKNFFNLVKSLKMGFEIYVGSKKQMLSFIYVEDLVNIILKLCETKISQKDYNLCDGGSYSISNVNQVIKNALNVKTKSIVLPTVFVRIIAFFNELVSRFSTSSPIVNQNKVNEMVQLNWLCDNSKIKEDIEFKPKFNLQVGIKKTIKWYKRNDWL